MAQSLEVKIGSGKIRADKWLSTQLESTSRSLIQRAFEEGLVRVNGVAVAKSAKLSDGDTVEYDLIEAKAIDLSPVDMSLDVIYEDDDVLVLNKPAGLVVHPGAGTEGPTLVNGLIHHCQGKLSSVGGPERPGIVHRLDRGTSGAMVVAKSDSAHHALVAAFTKREVTKIYLALVAGVPDRLSGTIKKSIGRNPTHRHKMAVIEDGKPAHTDWELLGSTDEGVSLLRCYLHTGRTHQIRVHLADLGFPILGDEVYGFRANRINLDGPFVRVLLHAHLLKLIHPITGLEQSFTANLTIDFSSLLPEAMQKLI